MMLSYRMDMRMFLIFWMTNESQMQCPGKMVAKVPFIFKLFKVAFAKAIDFMAGKNIIYLKLLVSQVLRNMKRMHDGEDNIEFL